MRFLGGNPWKNKKIREGPQHPEGLDPDTRAKIYKLGVRVTFSLASREAKAA